MITDDRLKCLEEFLAWTQINLTLWPKILGHAKEQNSATSAVLRLLPKNMLQRWHDFSAGWEVKRTQVVTPSRAAAS